MAVVAATILLIAGAAWFAGPGAGAGVGASAVVLDAEASPGGELAATNQLLVVDVAGAVVRPGVYRLPAGSRVADALASAGGFGPRVDAQRVAIELNLAAPLADGQHVLVPSRDDTAPGGSAGGGGGSGAGGVGGGSTQSRLIDLNRATSGELDTLPGIGPVTAAKIITSRETAPFAAVRDLLDRKLVGQKTFDGLADLVTVR